jgi:hypothetical protein
MFHRVGLWSGLGPVSFAFSHHLASIFVAAYAGEPPVTQPILRRPFQKLDSGDDDGI